MISHLAGTVCAVSPEGAVIEVGGVGLLVQCTPGTLATLRPGEAGPGGHLAGRQGRLAHPVRLCHR